MPDRWSLARAGEAPVGYEGYRLPKLAVAGDRLGRVEHLRHTRAFRPLVADDHRVSRLDIMRQDRGYRILLAVERAGAKLCLEHLLRNRGVLYHRAFRSEVALEDRDGAVRADRLIERADDIRPLEAPLLEVLLALLVIAALPQLLEVLPERLACDGHDIEMELGLDLLHHRRHAAGIVEELGRPSACRADIQEVMGSPVHPVEGVAVDLEAELMGYRGDVQQAVRGSRDGGMDHDRVLEALHRHYVACLLPAPGEPHRLPAGLVCRLHKLLARRRQQCRSREHQPQRLRHDLHRAGRAHEGACAAAGAGMLLVVVKLLLGYLAPGAHGRVGADLLERQEVRAGIHHASRDEDRGQVKPSEPHQATRHGLVAGRDVHRRVEARAVPVYLDHVGDHVAAHEGVVHPVVALRDAVAYVRGVVPGALASLIAYALDCGLDELVEMRRARMAVAEGAFNHDLRLVQILYRPSHPDLQRIVLRCQLAYPLAIEFHANLLGGRLPLVLPWMIFLQAQGRYVLLKSILSDRLDRAALDKLHRAVDPHRKLAASADLP